MARCVRRKHLVVALVIGVALAFFAVEAFVISPGVRVACVGGLDEIGAFDSLTGFLGDDDGRVRAEAGTALAGRGAAAVPALVRRLEHPDAGGRGLAAATLGRIGPPARDAIPALARRVRDDADGVVRTEAARALAAIDADGTTAIPVLIEMLETADEDLKRAAVDIIGVLGGKAAATVPALIRVLGGPQPDLRREAAAALGALGPSAKAAVPALAAALRDPADAVRIEAADALEYMPADAKEAVPALIAAALNDSNPKVRSEAEDTLRKIADVLGPGDAALRDRITEALKRKKTRDAAAGPPP